MSALRLYILLLGLLTLACKFEDPQTQGQRYSRPESNQYILAARSGRVLERYDQNNRYLDAGQPIVLGASIQNGDTDWALFQDDHHNLLLLYPESQIQIQTENTQDPVLELLEGRMAISCSSRSRIITGHFRLEAEPGTEATIQVDHLGAKLDIYQGSCRVVWTQDRLEELDQWFQEQNTTYSRMWQDTQTNLEAPMTYSWEHQWFRDQSIALGKLMRLPKDQQEQGLSRYFNNLAEGPNPQESALAGSEINRSWFSLLEDQHGPMNYRLIKVEPPQAQITYNDLEIFQLVELPLSQDEEHHFFFSYRGYEDGELYISAYRGERDVIYAMTQRSSQTYEIEVSPQEAEIYVNGLFAGKGRLQLTQNPGEELSLAFKLKDHITQELHIEDLGIYPDELQIELRESIQGHYYVTSKDLVGISFLNGHFIVADRSGNLTSVRALGGLRPWGLATSNYPNDWSSPVIAFNKIYFSGRRTLAVYDPVQRDTIGVRNLDYRSIHQYGRRVLPFGQTIALPTADSIKLLSQDLSSDIRSIPIPGGSMMTPLVVDDYLYTVGNDGRIFKINRSGQIEITGQSSAFSPMGGTMGLQANRIVFCDRKGLVTAFDKDTLEILWENNIDMQTNLVFRDVQIDGERVYIYSEGSVFPFSMENGDPQGVLAYNFATPPWIEDGLLYGCFEAGYLHIIRLKDQEVINRFELSGYPTSPVFASHGMVSIGMDNGRMLVINQPGWVPLQEIQGQ